MKTLYILRHAKSSWKHPDLADHDRPLNKRGKREAHEIGLLMRQEALVPDLILSSTAKRARLTAEMVAAECGYDGKVDLKAAFYPGEPKDYVGVLSALPNTVQSVMVVGHNPGLEELLEVLTGQAETLPTAALVRLELPIEKWGELKAVKQAKLAGFWQPSRGTRPGED